MSDPSQLLEATFQGCAETVGPLISLDLEVGEASSETTAELPDGDLAVLPMSARIDDEAFASLTLSSPIHEIVTLGRRMLGDEEPDKERDLCQEDLDAVGEVLNLMSGAVDQAVRSHVNGDVRTLPSPWWRSAEPGEHAFEEGEHVLGRCSLSVPGGGAVSLMLRLPPELLGKGACPDAPQTAGRVVIIGLDDETAATVQGALESARMAVSTSPLEDGLSDALVEAELVLIGGVDEKSIALLRELRLDDRTWAIPAVLCATEPTREDVIRAIAAGAYHVYKLGGDNAALLRTLNAARGVGE